MLKNKTDMERNINAVNEINTYLKELSTTLETIEETNENLGLTKDEEIESIKKEIEENKKEIDEINNNEEYEEMIKKSESNNIPTYINYLNKMSEEEPETKANNDKLIKEIEDSLKMQRIIDKNLVISKKDINNTLKKLVKEVNKKLKNSSAYIFKPVTNIEKAIKNNLPEEYKNKSKLIAIKILTYINNARLSNERLFIYFVIINILGLEKEINNFREEIIESLIKVSKTI